MPLTPKYLAPPRRSLLLAILGGVAGCGVPAAYVRPGERAVDDLSARQKRLTAAWVNYVCPVPAARDVLASARDKETAALAENALIFPDAEMRKRLVIARDITSKERVGFAKRWNAIVGL
jgi:spermidine/putrescine transport system substrate-binding protein